jgi:hypothetical protein
MNPVDGTLHCVEHGWLQGGDLEDVLARLPAEPPLLQSKAARFPLLVGIVDWIASRLPARCEVVPSYGDYEATFRTLERIRDISKPFRRDAK